MVQMIKMTEKEQYEMYMKLKKKEIVKMLIECNKQLDRVVNTLPIYNVVGQSEQLVCDSCGSHPSVIYTTPQGRFCEKCKPAN